MNSAIREFSPLVIIAFSALLIARIIAGYLTLILIFVLFLETLLLSYLFINNLKASDTIEVTLKTELLVSVVMATILTAIITNTVLQVTCANILLIFAIILVAASIIIAYRDRQISVFFILFFARI